jgi:ribonuclease P protein component
MTPRSSLRTRRDFARVYRSGRRARIDGVTVWAATASEPGPTRLGLTVPAATGGAVRRNRLRRRLREIVRAYRPDPGFDVVIKADAGATGRNFQELQQIVGEAFGRAGVSTGR